MNFVDCWSLSQSSQAELLLRLLLVAVAVAVLFVVVVKVTEVAVEEISKAGFSPKRNRKIHYHLTVSDSKES